MFFMSQFRFTGPAILLTISAFLPPTRAATGRLDPTKTAEILAFPGRSALKTNPIAAPDPNQPTKASAAIAAAELIDAGKYEQAIEAYTKALEADPENSSLFMGRGVAATLARMYKPAISDLERAQRLNPQNREAKLWQAAALQMSGDGRAASMLYPPGYGIPDDYASYIYNDMATSTLMAARGNARGDLASKYLRAGQWFARRV